MGIFGTLGSAVRERRRAIAASLAFVGVALGIFFAGSWAGSSGAFTLGPVTASASHAKNAPSPRVPNSDEGCSVQPMPSDKMRPNMPMPGGMPSDQMCPDMPMGKMGPGGPMGKMGPGMPMDKPMRDKMCCDKQ